MSRLISIVSRCRLFRRQGATEGGRGAGGEGRIPPMSLYVQISYMKRNSVETPILPLHNASSFPRLKLLPLHK